MQLKYKVKKKITIISNKYNDYRKFIETNEHFNPEHYVKATLPLKYNISITVISVTRRVIHITVITTVLVSIFSKQMPSTNTDLQFY